MATGKPYSMGIFETIVDVHFGSLAVEVFNGGGFDQISGGIDDFSKAVIAGWFRIPQKTLEFVAASGPAAIRDFDRIIPLFIFGHRYEGYNIQVDFGPDQDYIFTPWAFSTSGGYTSGTPETRHWYTGPVYSQGASVQHAPSFIGVYVNDIAGVPNAYLYIRLQTSTYGTGQWVLTKSLFSASDENQLQTAIDDGGSEAAVTDTAWSIGFNFCQTDAVPPTGSPWIQNTEFIDISDLQTQRRGPDAFIVFSDKMKVIGDHWHQFIVSFDIGHTMTAVGSYTEFDRPDCSGPGPRPDFEIVTEDRVNDISNPCKMWVSLDDINRTGQGLQYWGSSRPPSLGPNDIVSTNIHDTAFVDNTIIIHSKSFTLQGLVVNETNDASGIAAYEQPASVIPAAGAALGIPGTEEFAGNVYNVELAEFQLFTGVTLNTGGKAARRLFVSDKGRPVDPKVPAKFFKKQQDLLLHSSANWIKGKNTGTKGDFEPTMPIVKYKPDPSLRGPQK